MSDTTKMVSRMKWVNGWRKVWFIYICCFDFVWSICVTFLKSHMIVNLHGDCSRGTYDDNGPKYTYTYLLTNFLWKHAMDSHTVLQGHHAVSWHFPNTESDQSKNQSEFKNKSTFNQTAEITWKRSVQWWYAWSYGMLSCSVNINHHFPTSFPNIKSTLIKLHCSFNVNEDSRVGKSQYWC